MKGRPKERYSSNTNQQNKNL